MNTFALVCCYDTITSTAITSVEDESLPSKAEVFDVNGLDDSDDLPSTNIPIKHNEYSISSVEKQGC